MSAGPALLVKIRILGAAAGGGFPQWNCNCPNCDGLRRGTIRAAARSQSSIAITADSRAWVLINASPDILTQIRAWPDANPRRSIRDTAIAAIALVDSQIDHAAGLLMLREGRPLELYSTNVVREDLTVHLSVLEVLRSYCGVSWHELPRRDASRYRKRQVWTFTQSLFRERRPLIRQAGRPRARATTSDSRSRIPEPVVGSFMRRGSAR